MTYSQNISELRRQNKFATRVQQGYNTEAARWAAQASVAQGELIQKFTTKGAELMQAVHQQKQAALKAEAGAWEFDNRDAFDAWRRESSTEAARKARADLEAARKTLDDAEYQTQLQALDIKNARNAGVDPAIINNYKSMDPTKQRWIADARLKRLGDQYKPWLGSQFLNNDTELTYTDEDGKQVKFKINETRGSANRFQQRAAHKYLRSQYIYENGISNFTPEFRQLSGLNDKISRADNEFDATMTREADIQYSARESALAGHSLVTVPPEDIKSIGMKAGTFLTVTASGRDERGNVGMARAHQKLEDFLVSSMKSGEFTQEELDALQSAEIPESIAKSLGLKKDEDGKYPTYAKQWPNRYGEQGSLEKALLKANTDNAAEFDKKRANASTNFINDAIDEVIESGYDFQVYNRVIKEHQRKYPGQDAGRLETVWKRGRPEAIKNDERIRKIVENASNGVINDFSTDNLTVRSNPQVKALIAAQNEWKNSEQYKQGLTAIDNFQKTLNKELALEKGFMNPDGYTVNWILDRKFQEHLNKQIKIYQRDPAAYNEKFPKMTPYDVALNITQTHWLDNGGGDRTDTTKLFYQDLDGSYPNISKTITKGLKRHDVDEKVRKEWYTNQVNTYGEGDLDKALASDEPWLEHGNPDAVLASVAYLEERGDYPSQTLIDAKRLGRTPYAVLNARYKALHGKELDPKYRGYQETFLSNNLPVTSISELMKQNNDFKKIQAGSHIIKSLENQGMTTEEAQREFLRKGFGPVGTELSWHEDQDAAKLAWAYLIDLSWEGRTNAPEDLDGTGAVTQLADLISAEGYTFEDMNFGDKGKETLSLLTGDYSFLLRK